MFKIIKEDKENKYEETNKQLEQAIINDGVTFPFYLLHVCTTIAGSLQDDRTWFTGTYMYNDEQFYSVDKIDEDSVEHFGLDYTLDRVRSFKKFKQRARAEKFAENSNN